MIYRHCQCCGKRLPVGQTCQCEARIKKERDKVYDATKRNKKHAAFYSSLPWMKMQHECKERYANFDIYALYANKRVCPGRIAHHIIPLEDDWNQRLCFDNLICVSDSSHQEIHKAYRAGSEAKQKMQDTLRSYQKRWKKEHS